MDSRRTPRTVIDPKVRQVGFFAQPERSNSDRQDSIQPPPGSSLSPVMIPPPRPAPIFAPLFRRDSIAAAAAAGGSSSSYNPSDFIPPPAASPTSTAVSSSFASRVGVEDVSPGRAVRGGVSVRASAATASSSFPGGGFDLTAVRGISVPASGLTTVSVVNMPPGIAEKAGGAAVEMQNDRSSHSKPGKEKPTKAERRALQESQRAAKAAAKAEGTKSVTSASTKPVKGSKTPSHKNNNASVAASEKRAPDRPPEKDRKKDVPPPRLQYDDKSRVEKLKRRAVVHQTEARNRVELFRHLPQYERGTQLPDLESKFFHLDPVHPSVYNVGLHYLSGDISGGNARCIAMLQAFREAINDYSTPPQKNLSRDLTTKIGSYVSFLIECRPLSVSMGNAIKFLKSRITKIPLTMSESEAKALLQSDINCFISEKILLADNLIVKQAVTKIRDGDVLLTYGSSSAVEMILLHAHELGKRFRVVVIDSRPKLEGQILLRRLVGNGLNCTYANINAVSYVMHEVTRVFLGASSVLSNGTVYSRVGTASVAMVAHAFRVPVLVCCEAYKFHERVQLDSICSNELGDPEAIKKVPGREESGSSDEMAISEKLQCLNLTYDATPSDYISMIVTDYGMVPPTSVPVIVREYRREHMLI